MSFIETEASIRYEIIDGQRVPVIIPRCEVTLTNIETGKEYNSDAEALPEHVRRDVNITVAHVDLGTGTNLF
jgi:hypothetical protein